MIAYFVLTGSRYMYGGAGDYIEYSGGNSIHILDISEPLDQNDVTIIEYYV